MLHNTHDIYKSIAISYGFSSIKTVPKLQEFISLASEWEKAADDSVIKDAYRMLKSFEVQEPIASRLN